MTRSSPAVVSAIGGETPPAKGLRGCLRGCLARLEPNAFRCPVVCVVVALLTLLVPDGATAQTEVPDADRGLSVGPRLELGYAFDRAAAMGSLGAFVELDVAAVAQGRLAVALAATQFVFIESAQSSPASVEGSVLWGSGDRRLLLEVGGGPIHHDEGGSDVTARLAVGREYPIEPGRALRLQLALRTLGKGEASLGLMASYPFGLFR